MSLDALPFLYAAVFVCVLLLVEGAYYFFADKRGAADQRRINRRMHLLAEGVERSIIMSRLRRAPPEQLSGAAATLMQIAPMRRLEGMLARAAMSITLPRLVTYLLVGFACVFAILSVTFHVPGPLALVAAGLLAFPLPIYVIASKGARRIHKMEDQLPEALDMIVRSLRAGHPIATAIQLVAREMPDPLGSEFGLAADEMSFGLDLQRALENMSARVGFQDMRFVIISIRIQAQTGGNLSEVLGGLARLIRERHRLHLRVMSLSAEGRLSVKILAALPFCFFGLVSIMSPRYYADIRDNVTLQHVLEGGFVMLMIGIYLMRRIVNFRV